MMTVRGPDAATGADASPTRAASVLRAALAITALVALVLLARRVGGYVPQFATTVQQMGAPGQLAFVAGYAVASVFGVPGSILTLAAGAIFGLGAGVALVFIGAMLGSTLAFLVSRYLVRGLVARRLDSNPRFAAVDRAIAAQGRRVVLLLRLSPLFPFALLNYALGLTRISLTDYVLAGVGMLPGTVLYVYYGKLAGDVAALASGVATPRTTGYYVVLVVGLLATVAVTTLVTRTARAALRDSTERPTSPSAPAP